jgi:pyruvate,orthophosphate dikinase
MQMFGDVVLGLKPKTKQETDPFEIIIEQMKERKGVKLDIELSLEDLKELVALFKDMIIQRLGREIPENPQEQLWAAIDAVFTSWDNPRAISYRQIYNIPDDWGTAVNIQAMVFGNTGDDSASGVGFTRNPATGENQLFAEYLVNAQGEDVVAGIRNPRQVSEMEREFPQIYTELQEISQKLEDRYRDMQDIEFTIEHGKLWMLQTRDGKRTGLAMVKIALDMVEEGKISRETAILRMEADKLNELLRPVFDAEAKKRAKDEGRIIAKGLNAGPGAASGRVCFFPDEAEERARRGEPVILVRMETSPEDIRGMSVAQGILTSRGGMTSHAALVARQMGTVCVAGCSELNIDYSARTMSVNGKVIQDRDFISLDGTSGEVILGELPTQPSDVIRVLIRKDLSADDSPVYQYFARIMQWADEYRRLGVFTNADLPDQAYNARMFGAAGIGLCRTEHMFFEGDRIDAVREMILSDTRAERERALAKILPLQREDFVGIFRVMEGLPVTIRTLDPPLHEFLPKESAEIAELAADMGKTVEELEFRIESLREANPMLGHRGCRLGLVYPEITAMQARAILEAACQVSREGKSVKPEIMIPLVGIKKELEMQAEVVREVAEKVFAEQGGRVDYRIGTMIELPRAALVADQIAEVAEFFSFGTNDLTQTTFGFSRDDAGKFLNYYLDKGILKRDPFQTIDIDGVGQLMAICVKKGRKTRKDIKLGICGEHGGEPDSVKFCHRLGLTYVSCSPFRVPIARLAAAQAVLEERAEKGAPKPKAKAKPKAKRPAARKPITRKPKARKPAAKKRAPKKPEKKPAVKKPMSKKPPKKTVAKKPTRRR